MFLEILAGSRTIYRVRLYAWVLMENHFHLIVETPLGNLDEFMRRLAMELLYQGGGLTGEEIGSLLGVGYSTVSQERKRLRLKMIEDKALKGLFDRLVEKLST
jgi:hypothetical protein